jgi:hypothetical protein
MEFIGQIHAHSDLPWKKSPWYSLNTRLGGPQGRSGRCDEEKNILVMPAVESRSSSP